MQTGQFAPVANGSGLRAEPYFDCAVDGATAPYGSLGAQRATVVQERNAGLLA